MGWIVKETDLDSGVCDVSDKKQQISRLAALAREWRPTRSACGPGVLDFALNASKRGDLERH